MKKESSYSFLRERNIIVLILCRIVYGLAQSLFMPYFSLFALAQEGVTPELLGLVASLRAGGAGLAILFPIAGHLADSLGRKKMIFAGTTLEAISYLFYVIATDFRMIFIGSLMEGLAPIHMPALQAITQDSLVRSKRGLGLSTITGLQALPRLISPLIGGILVEQLGIDMGMRIGYSLGFGAGLTVAFIRLIFLKETVDRSSERVDFRNLVPLTKKSYSNVFSLLKEYKELQSLILLSMVSTFFGSIAAPFWVVYAKEVVGLSPVEWGLIQNISTGVNILVLLFSGKFADRFGRKRIMMINLLTAPIINLSFIYCQNFPQILLFQIFLTIQNAFLTPARSALLADIVPRESRGRAIAASSFLGFPSSFVGLVLSGYIFNLDARYPWFLLAGGFVLEFMICRFLIKEPEKPAE